MDVVVKVPVTVTVEYSAEDGGDAREVIRDIVESCPRIQPVRVVADCPYAQYVEFGTEPARKGSHSEPPFKEEIEEWVRVKLRISDEKEAKRVARAIYWRIIKEGLLPTPYFRPAINDTMSEVREDWLDMGHSFDDIAEGIVFRARQYLDVNDQNYTGQLKDSIEIEETFTGSFGPAEVGEIEDYIWNSSELGYDGIKRPDYRRWKRL